MAFSTYGMALLFSHITAFNTVANTRIRLMEHLGRLPLGFLVFLFLYDWRLSLVCLVPILIGFILLFGMLQGESEGFVAQVQKSGEDIGNAATEYSCILH